MSETVVEPAPASVLPNDKAEPLPDDTLAVTVGEDGAVLALLFSDETDVYTRTPERDWEPVPEVGHPLVDDQEWIDVDLSVLPAFDAGSVLVEDDLEPYRLS